MKILWFTWKDQMHPANGGAEVVADNIAKRLVRDGHEVIFLVGGFKECLPEEITNGYKVIRLGNRWNVYWKAYRYYKNHLQGWADFVIDEMNVVPFFCKFYVKEKNMMLVHQLCREIWLYEMNFPLNIIGYSIEPIYLRLISDRSVITVSENTKRDLVRYGFDPQKITVMQQGIGIEPAADIAAMQKNTDPTMLSLGSVRPMKRTMHAIKAFEIAKESLPTLQFILAGNIGGSYGSKVYTYIKHSPYADSITYAGKVSESEKIVLMQKSHVVVVPSVKEGWTLVVTEAASQGTPAVVYDVDGLRNSVRHDETGIICEVNTPEKMAKNIVKLLGNAEEYERLRMNGWRQSAANNFDHSYQQFISLINA